MLVSNNYSFQYSEDYSPESTFSNKCTSFVTEQVDGEPVESGRDKDATRSSESMYWWYYVWCALISGLSFDYVHHYICCCSKEACLKAERWCTVKEDAQRVCCCCYPCTDDRCWLVTIIHSNIQRITVQSPHSLISVFHL